METLLNLISSLFQLGANGDSWIQIAIILFVLLLVWAVIRIFLRLAFKVFATGCFLILVLGLILLAVRFI
jgi:hypothetical protein